MLKKRSHHIEKNLTLSPIKKKIHNLLSSIKTNPSHQEIKRKRNRKGGKKPSHLYQKPTHQKT
jgi:hypothetical protein